MHQARPLQLTEVATTPLDRLAPNGHVALDFYLAQSRRAHAGYPRVSIKTCGHTRYYHFPSSSTPTIKALTVSVLTRHLAHPSQPHNEDIITGSDVL